LTLTTGKFGVVIYTRQSKCAPIRAEEGLTGNLRPPNSSTKFRDLPESQQIGGYPTVDQALTAPNVTELSDNFDTLDCEGRCVILEFPAFVLIGVYNPATRDESRDAFRIAFLNLLDIRIRNLAAMGKRVILAGDLNIVRNEMDMANAETDLRKRGTTIEEYFSGAPRRILNQLLDGGTIYGERDHGRETSVLHDICRSFHPTRKGMFTCWETKINARPGNYGSRIDYILCSKEMNDWFCDSNIQEGLMGSDHCPVYAIIKDEVIIGGQTVNVLDYLNPPGMFEQGRRKRDYSPKDILPMSGRLLPEFSGRRSIRDMFSKQRSLSRAQTLSENPNLLPDSHTAESNLTTNRQTSQSPTKSQVSSKSETSSALDITASTAVGIKRSTSGETTTSPIKRQRPDAANSPNKRANVQQTLRGFFTLKPAQGLPNEASDSSFTETNSFQSSQDSQASTAEGKNPWSKILRKQVIPKCEGHQQHCISMVVKSKGINRGRSFWICPRPLGPSGNKEKGTEWRCGTFIWFSDWNSAQKDQGD
jgi:AP endonuclease 2